MGRDFEPAVAAVNDQRPSRGFIVGILLSIPLWAMLVLIVMVVRNFLLVL